MTWCYNYWEYDGLLKRLYDRGEELSDKEKKDLELFETIRFYEEALSVKSEYTKQFRGFYSLSGSQRPAYETKEERG